MGIFSWILFGLIAGALGKFFMPGSDPKGCLVTIGLGILGAVVGGYIATQMGLGTVTGFDPRSFIIAVFGTMLVLGVYRLLQRPPA